jgi:hypothetical protein
MKHETRRGTAGHVLRLLIGVDPLRSLVRCEFSAATCLQELGITVGHELDILLAEWKPKQRSEVE